MLEHRTSNNVKTAILASGKRQRAAIAHDGKKKSTTEGFCWLLYNVIDPRKDAKTVHDSPEGKRDSTKPYCCTQLCSTSPTSGIHAMLPREEALLYS